MQTGCLHYGEEMEAVRAGCGGYLLRFTGSLAPRPSAWLPQDFDEQCDDRRCQPAAERPLAEAGAQ
jgi:hypothetical protein